MIELLHSCCIIIAAHTGKKCSFAKAKQNYGPN